MKTFYTYPKKLSDTSTLERAWLFCYFKTVKLDRKKDAVLLREVNHKGVNEFLELLTKTSGLYKKENLLNKTVALVIISQIVMCVIYLVVFKL